MDNKYLWERERERSGYELCGHMDRKQVFLIIDQLDILFTFRPMSLLYFRVFSREKSLYPKICRMNQAMQHKTINR